MKSASRRPTADVTYTLNGAQVVKSIERQVFAAAAPACR